MLRSILLLIFIIFFQGCATWSGVKQDSKTAWQATKDTTTEVVKDVKNQFTKQRRIKYYSTSLTLKMKRILVYHFC